MTQSQWDYWLKNLGEWQGSFARFSPQGVLLEETPSLLKLEESEPQTLRLTLRRWPCDRAAEKIVQQYRPPVDTILFFDTGAFVRGMPRWIAASPFWVEYSLIDRPRRLRLVQQFQPDGRLQHLTLIREQLAGSALPKQPALSLDQLLGEWQGEAVTLREDGRLPQIDRTHLTLYRDGSNGVGQQLRFGHGASVRTLASKARIAGSLLSFEESPLCPQVLLLPGGASVHFPTQIQPGRGFRVELGWLQRPDRRQRLMCSYCDRGTWVSATLVTEQRMRQ